MSCGSATGSLVTVYLDATDYATFTSNGGFLETGMQFYANAGGDPWFNTGTKVYDLAGLTIYNLSSGVVGSVPAGGYC